MPAYRAFDLTDRVAVITGGAGLLGRQYTTTLLDAGAKIVVIDCNRKALRDMQSVFREKKKERIIFIRADISSKESVKKASRIVLSHWGHVDILVNNAALDPKFDKKKPSAALASFENYPLRLWKKSLDVDLTGAFLCSQVFGKIMLKNGKGVIVNIGSTYGITAPNQSLYRRKGEKLQSCFKPANYAVTKSALIHFSRYLAAYWGEKNIRVNSLSPGGIKTSQDPEFVFKYSQMTPLRRMAHPHEMSAALLFLVSDASSYMTGANLIVDGGWTAW